MKPKSDPREDYLRQVAQERRSDAVAVAIIMMLGLFAFIVFVWMIFLKHK